jgi:DNA mismatch repair ATPase MutL
LPARLDLAPLEAQRLLAHRSTLLELGIEIAPFGGTTHQLLGLPAPALGASPSALLGELAALVAKRDPSAEAIIDLLATHTARAAVARGLGEREVAALVDFASAGTRGLFVLSPEEVARRLAGSGRD